MLHIRRTIAVLALGVPTASGFASAQTDYRNLDGERPTFVSDAYPIERWAFEFTMPWRYERATAGSAHLLAPELSYGLFANGQIGISMPLAGVDGGVDTQWGLAGFHAFGLYNLTTESGSWPAVSARMDLSFPVGVNGGDATRVGAMLLATRSIGAQRLHVNLSASAGSEDSGAGVEPLPQWSAGLALDRTFIRESLLLIGEVYVLRRRSSDPTETAASVGARWQLSPTLVLDGGVGRRLSSSGPDLTVTLGVSHAFALAALLPSVRGASKPGGPR